MLWFPETMPGAGSLRKSVQCVFCVLRLSVNVIEGGGAGNFPLFAAAAMAAGSFRTDEGISSARLSSPPALRLGGDHSTKCQSQLNRLGGAKGTEWTKERLLSRQPSASRVFVSLCCVTEYFLWSCELVCV